MRHELRDWMFALVRAAPVVGVLAVGLLAAPACLAALAGATVDGVAAPGLHPHQGGSHECPVPRPLGASWLPSTGASTGRADAPPPDLDHAVLPALAPAHARPAAPPPGAFAAPGVRPRARLLVSARLRL